jgi:GTP-binding protein YchF
MGFRCGIVGLPNVGKSTLFNALTETAAAQAANYPFCTIEPNIGNVAVPDPRADNLARIAGSAKIIETQLGFVDIAGLVRGASKGEGLGNQFLANIREVDAIVHVLRCFIDGDVTHVEGKVDPIADAETVETELMLSDLESLERRVPNLGKKAQQGDKEAKAQFGVLSPVLDLLREGKPARLGRPSDPEEAVYFDQAQLLTGKPVLYVCNVEEASAAEGNALSARVFEKAKAEGARARPRDDGPRRSRRVPLRSRACRNRPRPRDPRRLRTAPSHHLLHLRPQGDAGVDAGEGVEGSAGRRRDPQRFRARLHPRRNDRL